MIRDFPENTIVRLANSIGISLKKQGSNYMGRCPSCKNGIRTANTGYDPIRNIWHCFSCNAKGQLKDLCELEDRNFKECMNGIGIDLAKSTLIQHSPLWAPGQFALLLLTLFPALY